jgi:hypothetical protein
LDFFAGFDSGFDAAFSALAGSAFVVEVDASPLELLPLDDSDFSVFATPSPDSALALSL